MSDVIESAKKGSADVLILALVEEEALHGYELGRRLEERSQGTLHFTLASLYATLYRLERRGWIRGRWLEEPGKRRRKCYRITPKGVAVLARQRADWSRFFAALTRVAGLEPV